ncbi:MAG: hypothetical protein GY854_26675 [Deltaproteobacteria bacterium]|nr:hypothetical protein [Deltaproteobacteria bacterium]
MSGFDVEERFKSLILRITKQSNRRWLSVLMFMGMTLLGCHTEKSTDEAEQRMQTLMHDWERADGALVFDLAPELLEMCLNHPTQFYDAMAADSGNFVRFVDALEGPCLTNQNDTVISYLEEERLRAISIIDAQQVEPQHEVMRQQVLDELNRIRSRYID